MHLIPKSFKSFQLFFGSLSLLIFRNLILRAILFTNKNYVHVFGDFYVQMAIANPPLGAIGATMVLMNCFGIHINIPVIKFWLHNRSSLRRCTADLNLRVLAEPLMSYKLNSDLFAFQSTDPQGSTFDLPACKAGTSR